MLEIGVLGPLELKSAGETVEVNRARERALLSLLVMEAGQTLSASRLIDGVWGEDLPANPLAALHTGVSRLRKAVGSGVIVTTAAGYFLDPDQVDVDVNRFEALVAATGGGPAETLSRLDEALDLWRGTPYSEFAYEDFAQSEIARLEEVRLVAVEARSQALLDLGRHTEAIPQLQTQVTEHPLRETIWAQLMLALYRTGRQADALNAYQKARAQLVQLGIEPGLRLTHLEEQILTQDPNLGPDAPPVSRAPPPVAKRFRLPTPLTDLIGRDQELALLTDQLKTSRLVTITGLGGVGKTRLALEAAHNIADTYQDGVIYVDLDQYDQRTGWTDVLASFLGTRVSDGTVTDQIVGILRAREQLLVFDGCEGFIDELPKFTASLLAACPGITVLGASRQRFGITGEIVHGLQPLPLPKPRNGQSPAVQLFTQRARAVKPQFDPDDADIQSITRIVTVLDGLPLAIELAATRSAYLSFADLAEQLEQRTDILVSKDPTAPRRHQSLQAAITVSWEALTPDQQETLEALSMLQTPWDLDAAAQMAGQPKATPEIEGQVIGLVDRSLIVSLSNSGPAIPIRFNMLRTIRGFALQQLENSGRIGVIEERHARVFAGLVEEIEDQLLDVLGPVEGFLEMIKMVEARLPDLNTALRWLLEHRPDTAVDMAAGLGMFWLQSQRKSEGEHWLRASLGKTTGDSPSRSAALGILGVAIRPGAYLALKTNSFAHPFSNWRDLQRYRNDDASRAQESVELISKALAMYERLGAGDQPVTRVELARSLATAGDLDAAEAVLLSVEADSDHLPQGVICYAKLFMARIELVRGRLDIAETHARHSSCEEKGHVQTVFGLDTLGRIALARGDWESASGHYQHLLTDYAEPNDLPGAAIVHLELSFIAATRGDFDSTRRHAGRALELGRQFGLPRIESMVRFAQGWAEYIGGRFTRSLAYFEHAHELSIRLNNAFGVEIALVAQGVVRNAMGDPTTALELFRAVFRETGGLRGTLVESERIFYTAHSYYLLGRHHDAAQLLGAASALREQGRMPWVEDWPEIPDPETVLSEALGMEVFERMVEEGQSMGFEAAVELALSD